MARLLLNTRVLLWSLADSAPRHPYDSGVVNRRVAGERPRYAPYTEDTLVQQTTADYLEQQLGWESVYAHNHEDFGSDSLLGRASDRDVVLTRPLRERLAALNPDLPAEACDDAVRITAAIVSQTIVAANREKYDLLRDGVPVTYRDARSRRVRRRLRMFDFDEPANNHFLCVRELWVRGSLYRRRRTSSASSTGCRCCSSSARTSTVTSRPPSSRTTRTTATPSRTCFTTTRW